MKNRDENMSGIGGISAAVPFMKREILGRAFATALKKRLIFGSRKSVLPIVRMLAAFFGGVATPARNRDENTSGNKGMRAAVPFMNREIRGQALAT